jgi:hypothetical protein
VVDFKIKVLAPNFNINQVVPNVESAATWSVLMAPDGHCSISINLVENWQKY